MSEATQAASTTTAARTTDAARAVNANGVLSHPPPLPQLGSALPPSRSR